jgi:PilZ domain
MGAEFQLDLNQREGRLAERRHLCVPVKVRRPGETWFKSQIGDLSVAGFRLQTFMKLTGGDSLWVMLPGFEGRRAHVLWTRGHEAGCQFERPLHPAILDHIVKISH